MSLQKVTVDLHAADVIVLLRHKLIDFEQEVRRESQLVPVMYKHISETLVTLGDILLKSPEEPESDADEPKQF